MGSVSGRGVLVSGRGGFGLRPWGFLSQAVGGDVLVRGVFVSGRGGDVLVRGGDVLVRGTRFSAATLCFVRLTAPY